MLYFNKSLLNYNKKQRITNNLTCYCDVMGRQTKVTAPGGVVTNTPHDLRHQIWSNGKIKLFHPWKIKNRKIGL